MSVKTTADANIDYAKDCIRQAAKAISEVLFEEVLGYEDYSDDFKEKLKNTLNGLIGLKQNLE